MYEGYGPNGVALLIECLSDNRNRAAGEVRLAVTRNGGSMADPGSVSYLFARRGVVIVKKSPQVTEESLMNVVIDAGAEEINDLGENFEIVSDPSDMPSVRKALEKVGVEYDSADTPFSPPFQFLWITREQQKSSSSSRRLKIATTYRMSTQTSTFLTK